MKHVPFCDQREVTDGQFLDHLRLPGASGNRLTALRKKSDAAELAHVVAQHFRARRGPVWPFYMHGTAWLEGSGRGSGGDVVEKADSLLRHRFRNSWPPFDTVDIRRKGADPDWRKGARALQGAISRNTFVPELSTAFALTGNPRYIRKACDLMYSFVKHYPFVLHEGFFVDHDCYFGSKQNSTLGVANRVFRWIDLMHSGTFQVPGVFSDADVLWFVKQLWFYAMQFYRFSNDPMRRDNHHLVSHGHARFVLGVMFPEFSVAKDLLREGRKTILFHFANNVLKDGSYAEHSIGYQYHILYHHLNPLALATANGMRLFTARQIERLARWVEFNAHACKPDGMYAAFGDGASLSPIYLFDPLAAPVMSPKLDAMARALGFLPGPLKYATPAQLTRRFRDWSPGHPPRVGLTSYFANKGSHPEALDKSSRKALPTLTSAQYPNGGFTFFRSDWTRETDFLAVSHYTDSLPHCHTHWDMMSFVLHSQGETLIGDPAGTKGVYTSGRTQEYRGYLYSMDAHNCLVMNDDTLKPLKALGHECCNGGYPPRHGLGLFEAGGPIEVAEIWHDAYSPTRHRRYVVHLKGLGFAFVDMLSQPGPDLRPNQYAQRFHFESGVRIAPKIPRPGRSLCARRNKASCVIVPGKETETLWNSRRDRRLIGLHGVADKKQGPWVAELVRCQRGPSVFATFLLTQGAVGLSGLPKAQYLGKSPAQARHWQHEGVSAHTLDLGPHGTLLLASCPYGKLVESETMSTDGELAVAILDAKGRLRSWCLARGSKLAVRGKRIASGRRRQWRASEQQGS